MDCTCKYVYSIMSGTAAAAIATPTAMLPWYEAVPMLFPLASVAPLLGRLHLPSSTGVSVTKEDGYSCPAGAVQAGSRAWWMSGLPAESRRRFHSALSMAVNALQCTVLSAGAGSVNECSGWSVYGGACEESLNRERESKGLRPGALLALGASCLVRRAASVRPVS
ncbi:hypothetical protein DM02DRAFT_283202 [Periconia macrospinosa]|uniref:Uncharacterized protein n=1 Tax=Periconia macrospinosa TaxID=97972 RepID=A0A2V1EAJ2_9PLEO|nr:hypothetical protein DM02DRAFT_283202 [Periconia macrospinosa]